MKRLLLIGLVLVLVFLAPIELNTYDKETEIAIVLGKASYIPYQDEYEKMLYPTVRISTPSGTGSGVIISHRDTEVTETNIYVLTAAHVVGNESNVQVEFFYQVITKIEVTVIITDTAKDLALLRITNPPQSPFNKGGSKGGFYNATLAPKDYKAYLFAPVWAVGCSLGLPPRPSYGHLCAFAVNNWEISAPVLPGNSGGPVYDARTFEVIGIAVWVKVYQYQLVTTMAGIVPINQIYEFLEGYKRLQ